MVPDCHQIRLKIKLPRYIPPFAWSIKSTTRPVDSHGLTIKPSTIKITTFVFATHFANHTNTCFLSQTQAPGLETVDLTPSAYISH